MENDTSDEGDGVIQPVFGSGGSYFSAMTVKAIFAAGSTLFSVYLMVCIFIMKTTTRNSYIKPILNLAIIDTSVGVALIGRAIFEVFKHAEVTYETCAIWSYIFVSLESILCFHILAIGIHRYRLIRNSRNLVSVQQRYSHGVKSLAIWIAVILVALPPFVVWMRPGELMTMCRIDALFNTSNNGPVVYLLILFITPWLVTNILYISIVKQVWCHSSNTIFPDHTSDTTRISDSSSRPVAPTQEDTAMSYGSAVRNIALNREKSIIRTISILLVVFNISILSYICILFNIIVSSDFKVPGYVFTLTLSNNLLNPFVYAFSVPHLRHEMKTNLVTMWTYCRSKYMCIMNK